MKKTRFILSSFSLLLFQIMTVSAEAGRFSNLQMKYVAPISSLNASDLAKFESSIGYKFKDKRHLLTALGVGRTSGVFERNELFGDKLLDVALIEILMNAYPKADQGDLSSARTALVSQEPLAALGVYLDLPLLIQRTTPEVTITEIADTLEALITALYFDGGAEEVERFVKRFFIPMLPVNSCPSTFLELQKTSKTPVSYLNTGGVITVVPGSGLGSRPLKVGKTKQDPVRLATYLAERKFAKSFSTAMANSLVILPLDSEFTPLVLPEGGAGLTNIVSESIISSQSLVSDSLGDKASIDTNENNFILRKRLLSTPFHINWDEEAVSKPIESLNVLVSKMKLKKSFSCGQILGEEQPTMYRCVIEVEDFGNFSSVSHSKKLAERFASDLAFRAIQLRMLISERASDFKVGFEDDMDEEIEAATTRLSLFCQANHIECPTYDYAYAEKDGQLAFTSSLQAPWLFTKLQGEIANQMSEARSDVARKAISYIRHLMTQNLRTDKVELLAKLKNAPKDREKVYLLELSTQLDLKPSFNTGICSGTSVSEGVPYKTQILLTDFEGNLVQLEGQCASTKIGAENNAAGEALVVLTNEILKKEIPDF